MDHVDLIRHFTSVDKGRRVMESTFGKVAHDPMAVVNLRARMQKAASADDPELMKIALRLAGDGDVFEMYERLGGTFTKEAIGTPMFSPPAAPTAPAMSAPTVQQAPKPGAGLPQTPKPGTVQPQQNQAQQAGSTPKIKVQLQPQQGAQQGTSVSVG